MPLEPTWQDIGLRLLLTLCVGAQVGLNREVQGHAAGLRTSLLVALAASVSMISANLLRSALRLLARSGTVA
jgi:putative Mg2+ transporter-C (MgtC) family protein